MIGLPCLVSDRLDFAERKGVRKGSAARAQIGGLVEERTQWAIGGLVLRVQWDYAPRASAHQSGLVTQGPQWRSVARGRLPVVSGGASCSDQPSAVHGRPRGGLSRDRSPGWHHQ